MGLGCGGGVGLGVVPKVSCTLFLFLFLFNLLLLFNQKRWDKKNKIYQTNHNFHYAIVLEGPKVDRKRIWRASPNTWFERSEASCTSDNPLPDPKNSYLRSPGALGFPGPAPEVL